MRDSVEGTDRRVRRTQRLLQNALITLILEKKYDSITVEEILNRADVGRATFYSHFSDKDQLLLSGAHELRKTLNAAVEAQRLSSKAPDAIIGFSRAMFEHTNEYREVYDALLHTKGWPVFRERLEEIFDEIIRRECKTEIQNLKKVESDVPVDLFIHYLRASFFSVLTWWLDRRSRLSPGQINEVFRSLVLPTIRAVLK